MLLTTEKIREWGVYITNWFQEKGLQNVYWAKSWLLRSSQIAESQCTWLSDTTGHKRHSESSNNSNRPGHKWVSAVSFAHTADKKTFTANTKFKYSVHTFSHLTLNPLLQGTRKKIGHSSIYDKLLIDTTSTHTFSINADSHFQIQMQSKIKHLQHAFLPSPC